MNRKWFLLMAGLFLMVGNSFAQDSIPKKKKLGLIVKVDVLGPLNTPVYDVLDIPFVMRKHFALTLEKTFRKRNSIQLTGVYSWNTDVIYDEYYNTTSRTESKIFELITEYKFFILEKKICSGPYVGTYLKYIRDEEKKDWWLIGLGPNEEMFSHHYFYKYSLGIIMGYQCYIKNKIVVDFLAGFGEDSVEDFEYMSEDMSYRLALNIGYKF